MCGFPLLRCGSGALASFQLPWLPFRVGTGILWCLNSPHTVCVWAAGADAASSTCLIMTSFSLWVPLAGFCFLCYRSSQLAMFIHHLLGRMMALREGSHMASFRPRTKRRGWSGLWTVVIASQLRAEGTEMSRAGHSPIKDDLKIRRSAHYAS